jgi:CRP-like cAMP-binding protein
MTRIQFTQGQILFREGDPSDGVFRLLSGTVDVVRELGSELIVLGTVGSGQFIGEMGVVENVLRSATVRAASAVEAEFLDPTEFLDQVVSSPVAARELILRLSQRLRKADDRIVDDERRSGNASENRADTVGGLPALRANNAYLAAEGRWLERQLQTPLRLDELPFVVGRRPVGREAPAPRQPDLTLDDEAPFRLSRNHFSIEARDGNYEVHDLGSTLGTIVNGEPIGNHFRTDHAELRPGENEVVAGGLDSPFVFSVLIEIGG